jgi:hypothetical protein
VAFFPLLKTQLRRDRVRLQNQMECLLEEMRIPSAAELTSWVRTCPGKEEAPKRTTAAAPRKGNKCLRRVLNQAAHAAVRKNGSHFQAVFRRLLPRLGYQSAIWAIAHRLCRMVWKILHEGVRFIEQGSESIPRPRSNAPGFWREPFVTFA